MEMEARRERLDHAGETDVLHDDGVDACGIEFPKLLLGIGQLTGEDEGVEGAVAADVVLVKELHEFGKVLLGEVVRAQASVEARHAEVDRVGAIGDGGAGAVPVASGGEEFGFGAGKKFGHLRSYLPDESAQGDLAEVAETLMG